MICERCTNPGFTCSTDGEWLCEGCLLESAVADEYAAFDDEGLHETDES